MASVKGALQHLTTFFFFTSSLEIIKWMDKLGITPSLSQSYPVFTSFSYNKELYLSIQDHYISANALKHPYHYRLLNVPTFFKSPLQNDYKILHLFPLSSTDLYHNMQDHPVFRPSQAQWAAAAVPVMLRIRYSTQWCNSHDLQDNCGLNISIMQRMAFAIMIMGHSAGRVASL